MLSTARLAFAIVIAIVAIVAYAASKGNHAQRIGSALLYPSPHHVVWRQ
jgi:hypothetical protein